MAYDITSIFKKNYFAYRSGKRRAINQGGTSSSKTYSILQLLSIIAEKSKEKYIISVVSESFPHLQKGAIRDFKKIMGERFQENSWNRTNSVYTFPSGSLIEFFSVDDPSKSRGPRRDILFINECNNVPYETFDQLDIRTNKFTFLDYNPVSEFWIHEKAIINNPENEYIHSTYLDAKDFLPVEIVKAIESHRERDPNWWRVFGLGEVGKLEGLVHPNFQIVDSIPDGNFIEFYGLDFGFSSDPTALVKCIAAGDELLCDLLIYEKGLTNQQIAARMESLGVRKRYDEIYADCAEPKSIHEIALYGYNIKQAPKGPDSVLSGIQKVNQFRQYWTKRSIEAIKEQRNYRYIEDSSGKMTNKPMDDFNHAMDARRYAIFSKSLFRPGRMIHMGAN